jgi:osmotically-inducible protein OsmY
MKKFIALSLVSSILLTACAPAVVGTAAQGAVIMHDRRTAGTIVEDKAIEMRAAHEMNINPELKENARIKVVSYNRRVLLIGQVPNAERKRQIEEMARGLDEVVKVYNELEIADTRNLSNSANDAWLTTKVKANAFGDVNVDPIRVKVYSENGTVYLMGLVTREEADLATENVRNIDGVQKVVRVFDYLD